ncbi:MAG: Colicin V production protein [Parcubacteria group bacterium GW2011_GWC2_39_14]|nr:MAG: Colicin V production protein [Parcubacteria group bacterium GW2011_GWC2_39_14]KKR55359.1 MAG: Colicin V production protein [Parcubacteria group bacterium GW2011_GWA2_40_23]
MVILDYILLGIIILLGILGLRRGLIQSVGSIIGIIVGTLVASRFYPLVADWFGGSNLTTLLTFIVIFSITVKLVSILFWLLGKIFKIITILPIISHFDRFLGLILGLVEGLLVLAVILSFLLKYPFNYWIVTQMGASVVAKVLLKIGFVFIPLFPDALKKIKSFM